LVPALIEPAPVEPPQSRAKRTCSLRRAADFCCPTKREAPRESTCEQFCGVSFGIDRVRRVSVLSFLLRNWCGHLERTVEQQLLA
jgi:hypothetical protein